MEERNKPQFDSLPVGVIPVVVNGRMYDARLRGPIGFKDLVETHNYAPGFVQGTFRDQLNLLYGAFLNWRNLDAESTILITKHRNVAGNTAILYTPQLVIVQDIPQFENGRIVMNEKSLTAKLSKSAKKGVRFSDDGTVRALPYGFETGYQDRKQITKNPFPIALTGDDNVSETLVGILEEAYVQKGARGRRPKAQVKSLEKVSEHEIRISVFRHFGLFEGYGFQINGAEDFVTDSTLPYNTTQYSFGVEF